MGKTFSKVVVTGAAGFVGSTIIDQMLASDMAAEIVGIDNLVRGRASNLAGALASGRVQFVEGDIRDRGLMERLMDGCDLLFHQAALRITHCAADPRQAMEVMALATFDLLELAVKHRVDRVVAASSASIYGLADRFPTDESCHPYDNRTLYGACKMFNEGLLRSFNDMFGLNYVALRYFNVFGPRMDIHGVYTEVLIRWMERIAEGKPPLIFGDGTQTMDFIYIDDVARANVLAAQSSCSDEVFNIASGTETSLKELAIALLRVMGSSLPIEYTEERKINPVPRRLADTRLAREKLNFTAAYDLEVGLKLMVDWWRAQKGMEA
ncbi:NAD-dependent epimerase/dehydratase family protein [Magnetospirillum sp. 15-1]|uniref:NAD-dependent epimerase/dehydratase family protein n=1 Tax=Magnetospirillum sp. 15-1 TaxID=1979370 RepID=UPI000BBC6B83|nr:NAD-dependent epimerase/dehydratase family protein [Magnetospirillum sp. 15-1]